jgi:hypothetical protein
MEYYILGSKENSISLPIHIKWIPQSDFKWQERTGMQCVINPAASSHSRAHPHAGDGIKSNNSKHFFIFRIMEAG